MRHRNRDVRARVTTTLFAGAALGCALAAGKARADEGPPPPDEVTPADVDARHAIDRTWLYLDDARVPAQGVVVGMTSLAYTGVGSNPDQVYSPFAFNTAQPGWVTSLGAEAGLLPRMSIIAVGQLAAGGEGANGPNAGAVAGLRFQLSPLSWSNVHLLASVGYLRESWTPTESRGDHGAWVEAALSADIRALRLGFTGHGEHVFATGRDALDVMLKVGASYRVVGPVRLGAEWVGQDLEETFSDAAEGGARQFVGPTASLQLLNDRLTIVGGPSLGLSDRSPKVLGRLALAYGF